MKIRSVVLTGTAAAAMAIAGIGTALAGGGAAATPKNTNVQTPVFTAPTAVTADTDTTQSGDQTTPDTGKEAPEAAGTEKAGTEKAGTEAPEKAGAEGPESANDGPGGHTDPAGQNVDHQFEGQE